MLSMRIGACLLPRSWLYSSFKWMYTSFVEGMKVVLKFLLFRFLNSCLLRTMLRRTIDHARNWISRESKLGNCSISLWCSLFPRFPVFPLIKNHIYHIYICSSLFCSISVVTLLLVVQRQKSTIYKWTPHIISYVFSWLLF